MHVFANRPGAGTITGQGHEYPQGHHSFCVSTDIAIHNYGVIVYSTQVLLWAFLLLSAAETHAHPLMHVSKWPLQNVQQLDALCSNTMLYTRTKLISYAATECIFSHASSCTLLATQRWLVYSVESSAVQCHAMLRSEMQRDAMPRLATCQVLWCTLSLLHMACCFAHSTHWNLTSYSLGRLVLDIILAVICSALYPVLTVLDESCDTLCTISTCDLPCTMTSMHHAHHLCVLLILCSLGHPTLLSAVSTFCDLQRNRVALYIYIYIYIW